MLEQPFLTVEPAAVSTEGSIGGDDAVAGNHDGNGVPPVRGPDRPRRPRAADPPGELRVAHGLAERNRPQALPDQVLKRRAGHRERQLEIAKLALEIGSQLLADRSKNRVIPLPAWFRPDRGPSPDARHMCRPVSALPSDVSSRSPIGLE